MTFIIERTELMKKDIIKTIHSTLAYEIDSETGEEISYERKDIKIVVNPDDFALVFASFWNSIIEKPLSKSDVELLGYLIQNYAEGTVFTINKAIKEILSKRSGKSASSYNNSTKHLLEYDFIFQVGDSKSYKLNPRYAFKGSTNDRKQALISMTEHCKTC